MSATAQLSGRPPPTAAQSPVTVLQSSLAAPQLSAAIQHQPGTPQALLLQSEPKSPQSLLDPSSAAKLGATENLKGDSEKINQRTEEHIKQCLHRATARLCLSEFAVGQESVRLLSTREDAHRKILEGVHRMGLDSLSSCACHFSQVLQQPCQPVLAMLSADRETLQPEMLSTEQQKGCDACEAKQDSVDGLLAVLTSSCSKSLGKSLVVSVLTGEECEHRCGVLQEPDWAPSRGAALGLGWVLGGDPLFTLLASQLPLCSPQPCCSLRLGVEGAVWVFYLLSACCLLPMAAEEPVWEPTAVTGNQSLT
ncbi:zinc finger SWIM domain-containing protein 1 [Columba livia]|uniref:zinc finger SWIM domain-containing protein 1 n=1 Tax=Columba livia TaxID=8932 RepID=UPI0031BB41A7